MVSVISEGKQALVFGSHGQLGSRIKESLEASGLIVVEPIYFSKSMRPGAQKTLDIEQTLAQGTISKIINASSPNAAFAHSNSQLVEDWATLRSAELARLMESLPKAHLIHLSTVQVYGERSVGVIDESDSLLGISPYALMHKRLEAGLEGVSRVTIFRLGNVFGPPGRSGNMSWELLTHDIARQFALGGKARIRSNPNQMRDFVPASLLIEMLERILAVEVFGVFNLVTGESTTFRNWANFIRARAEIVLGGQRELIFESADEFANQFRFNRSKIQRCLAISSPPLDLKVREMDGLIRYAITNGALGND